MCKLILRRITEVHRPSNITELLPKNSDSHSRVSRNVNYYFMCPRYNKETGGVPFNFMKQSSGIQFLYKFVKSTPSVPLVRLHKKKFLAQCCE